MKKTLLLVVLLVACSFSAKAQTLIDVQFGGNNFNSTVSSLQTGAGLIGTTGDQWNNLTNTTALESGVSLLTSAGVSSGATLTASGVSGLYQYSTGPGDAYNPPSQTGPNALWNTSVANLTQGELGDGSAVTLTFNNLQASTDYNIYLYTEPDRWERSASWSVNGGTAQTVAALNTYPGPNNYDFYGNPNVPGYPPDVLVSGYNYVQFTGTTDSTGKLTILGTSISGDANINGLQIEATPEPSTYVLILTGLLALVVVQRKRASKLA